MAQTKHEAEQAPPTPGATDAPFPFSRPVVVDRAKIEIADVRLMATTAFAISPPTDQDDAQAVRDFTQAAATRAMQLIDMLDRVVEGGTVGRPSDELWPMINEVSRQMNAPQKNSGTGS